MEGEIVYFRKKLIGGFNRKDVIEYIAAVAKERNEAVDAKEKADAERDRLQGEVNELQTKLAAYEKLIGELKARGQTQYATELPHRPVIKIKRKKEGK